MRLNTCRNYNLPSETMSLTFSQDVRDAREQMHLGGVSYPTMPLQEAPARPHTVFGQGPAACSPTASFPAQTHSSYFSGLTGPQHPFYNRVRHTYALP